MFLSYYSIGHPYSRANEQKQRRWPLGSGLANSPQFATIWPSRQASWHISRSSNTKEGADPSYRSGRGVATTESDEEEI